MSKTSNQTITEKLVRLSELSDWFDSEAFTLEKALDKFAEAEKLAEDIDDDLKALKNKVTVIKQRFDG